MPRNDALKAPNLDKSEGARSIGCGTISQLNLFIVSSVERYVGEHYRGELLLLFSVNHHLFRFVHLILVLNISL